MKSKKRRAIIEDDEDNSDKEMDKESLDSFGIASDEAASEEEQEVQYWNHDNFNVIFSHPFLTSTFNTCTNFPHFLADDIIWHGCFSCNHTTCNIIYRLFVYPNTVEPVLKERPSWTWKCGLSRQVVFGDRFKCIEWWNLLPEICGLSRQVVSYDSGLSREVLLYAYKETDVNNLK